MSARSLATGEEIRVILLSVVLFAAAALAPAQTTNGTFHGTVADTSGAVVPYATVQVKNLATGAARQATTSDVGFYTVPQIPPDTTPLQSRKPVLPPRCNPTWTCW